MAERRYRANDLLTLKEAAEALGYQYKYLCALADPDSKSLDPELMSIRIETDDTFRRAFHTRALYVFRYGELRAWFDARQSRPTVQQWNEGRGIIVS